MQMTERLPSGLTRMPLIGCAFPCPYGRRIGPLRERLAWPRNLGGGLALAVALHQDGPLGRTQRAGESQRR